MALPPLPPLSMRPSNTSLTANTQRTDIDGLSEKYWGEILERTLSSTSLHNLQRTYGHNHNHYQTNHFSTHNSHQINNHSNLLNNNTYSDINLNKSENNLYYSNSEPQICEHDLHDINCAKNKAFFGAFNKIDDI